MSRPSEQEISEALTTLAVASDEFADHLPSFAERRRAVGVLRKAVKPREVWPSKEASEYLGVQTAHLPKLRGLPAPAQVLDRPSRTHPEKKAYLYYADEIREFGIGRRRAGRGGS